MNSSSANNQITFLVVAILVAAVVVTGGVLFSRSSNDRSVSESGTVTAQQLIELRQDMSNRLSSLERKINTESAQPTNPVAANILPTTTTQPMTASSASTTKTIYQDPAGRFTIVAASNTCRATAIIQNNEAPNSTFPDQHISIQLPSYGEWMTYYVLTKAQLDSFEAQHDVQEWPNREGQLSDNSFLVRFGPQDLPDLGRDCTLSARIK